ncbi:MAG: 4-amino-4-deoxy-L-arabinose transferase and related glycosyltransferases of PMT family, partial [uncultured Solirubrobacteraceae bacterium]
ADPGRRRGDRPEARAPAPRLGPGRRRTPARRPRPAAVGHRPRAAVRLQHGRERALRPAGHRAVRPRPEPALLRQPARLHLRPARRLRGVVRRPGGGGGGLRDGSHAGVRPGPPRVRPARDARGRPALPRRNAARRPPRRLPGRRAARGGVPAGLLLAPGAQRRADARPGLPLPVGRRGRPAHGAGARLRRRGPRGRARRGHEVHGRDRAGAAARGRGDPPRGPADPRGGGARPGPGGRRGPPRLRRGQPVGRPGLRGVPGGPGLPVLAGGGGGGQARRHPGQRPGLLRLDPDLGAGLGAGARRGRRRAAPVAARPPGARRAPARGGALRPLHGPADAVLRALAAARLPAPVPPGRRGRRAPQRAARRRAPAPAVPAARGGGRRPGRPGAAGLDPRRAGPLPPGHPGHHAGVPRAGGPRHDRAGGRGRPGGAAGDPRRGGARGPQRLVARRRPPVAARPDGQPLGEVPDRPRRGGPARGDRGLRAHAPSRPARPLRGGGLLLGRDGLHAARAGGGRAPGGPARRGLLPRARPPREGGPRLLAVPEGRGTRGVQLRLVLRLLPARLRPAGTRDDGPPARWRPVRRGPARRRDARSGRV